MKFYLTLYILFCLIIIQCNTKPKFEKYYYSVNTGLYNKELNNSKEIMLFNKIENDILEIKYYEENTNNNDTIIERYNLSQATNTTTKKISFNNKIETIYKYSWIYDDVADSDFEIFLTHNKKNIIKKDVSWVRIHSFYKDSLEKELIEIILVDTSGFFNSPFPKTPPEPIQLE